MEQTQEQTAPEITPDQPKKSTRKRKPRARKKPTRTRRPKAAGKPLPPPVDVEQPAQDALKEPADPFDFRAIFSAPSAPGPSSIEFSTSSTSSEDAPGLSPEAERILRDVPHVIGDTPADAADVDPTPPAAGFPAAPLGAPICTPQIMAHALTFITGKIADIRRRAYYRLDGSAVDMLSAPYAQIVNALWERYAPAILSNATNALPGLGEAMLLTAVVFGPLIGRDIADSQAERAARNRPRMPAAPPTSSPTPDNAHASAQRRTASAPGGVIWASEAA